MIMKRLTATKEVTFAMAHMLDQHKGLCRNLHGHQYKLLVTLENVTEVYDDQTPEKEGMVVDFSEIKKIIETVIISRYDHACMINTHTTDDFEIALWKLLIDHNKKIACVNFRPTAENMAKDIFNTLEAYMPIGVHVVGVKLYETETSYAEVTV